VKSIITVQNLTYRYPDGTEALREVSFEIGEAETVALMGPNGAGKTTLFLHLNGLLKGNTGDVRIFGSTLDGKKSLREVRRRIGIVFQNPEDQLFCPTVFDDVAFGPLNYELPPEEVKLRVQNALEAVGMSGFEDRVSHHLSFGEKKRISLATVLSMTPEVILLDEPTSNLDPRSRRKVMGVIGGLKVAKVIATHDLEMALELCKRGIIMDEGRVVADGQTSDILRDANLLQSHGLEVPYSLR
jgi:cobalt/nickel transport system ATP-binding protein